ncbi:endonuclease domain-containing protein [Corynebacterium sp. UBA2622]|uniref:endonuclease domain-containing protein n=1 Tax=Corynebacterium sp. UBA2622 TaxID=1946393 RepID=UPI0025B87214|nr:DUF559 domain-containing protein [Corynebacterium sp. UBA2622]
MDFASLPDVPRYHIPDCPELPIWRQRAVQAYAVGRGLTRGVLVLRAAARLTGVWVAPTSAELVEIALPSGRAPGHRMHREGRRYVKLAVRADDILDVQGVRCLHPLHNALEIARAYGFAEGVVAVDSLFHGKSIEEQRVVWVELHARCERMRGLRGVRYARQALEHMVRNSGSAPESYLRARLIEAGIGPIEVQHRAGRYYIDLLVGQTVAVEIDGNVKYLADARSTESAERQREKQIQNKGYYLLRFKPWELFNDLPGVLARIRTACEVERARRISPPPG